MTRAGSGVRLGVGASMLALALTALAAQPWVRQGSGPRVPVADEGGPPAGARAAVGSDVTGRASARPAPEATDEARPGVREPVETGAHVGVAPERPEIRLPTELRPIAPDVVIALPVAEADQLVTTHRHLTESSDAAPGPVLAPEQGAMATADGTGRSVAGPEPGDVYWFGPEGLQKVVVLTEEPR